ncbi:MAG: DedA family protein [Phycisphaerae bacterium]
MSLWDLWDMFVHLDRTLDGVSRDYQAWTYLILFVVIFCETGLVVTPFLPGDSLLFAAGTLAARPGNALEVGWVYLLLTCAAVCGDNVNYWIGRFIGPKIFHKEKVRLLNKEYLDRAHAFYERHGGKAVAIGRFLPIIRTFVPFVAGIGSMFYPRFLTFSVCGTLAWMATFVFAGFFFGNIEVVQKNFVIVVMAIVVISLIPAFVGFIRTRMAVRQQKGKM